MQSFFFARTEGNGSALLQPLSNHPQGTIDLMFVTHGGMECVSPDGTTYYIDRTCVMGQQKGHFSVRFREATTVCGIAFFAEAFNGLLPWSSQEFTNAGFIVESAYEDLLEQLALIEHNELRVPLLEAFIEKQLIKRQPELTSVHSISEIIRQYNGVIDISALCCHAGTSERTLQRKFKDQVGVTAKAYANIMRFNYVLKLLQSERHANVQQAIHDAGYYDQAHLIKDFKRYTGKTPKQYFGGDTGLSNHFLGQID